MAGTRRAAKADAAASPHWVLVRDRLARAVPERDRGAVRELEDGGWTVVARDAPTAEAGYLLAARLHGAVQADYDDRLGPVPMAGPTVLYRSVSVPELIDVLRTGAVVGRQNRFNPWDPRRLVFFADVMDGWVLGQGEQIDRQAPVALEDDPLHRQIADVERRRLALDRKIAAAVLEEAEDGNDRLERLCGIDRDLHEDFLRGDAEAARAFARAEAHAETVGALVRQRSGLTAKWHALRQELADKLRAKHREIAAAARERPVTSAVIVTRPVDGGWLYAASPARPAMPVNEYGLLPGRVTADDIESVVLVKDGRPLRTVAYAEAAALLAELDDRRSAAPRTGP